MRCPNCGNENPADYVFCDECGARLQNMGGEGAQSSAPLNAGDSGGSTSGDDGQWQPSGGLDSAGVVGDLGGMNDSDASGAAGTGASAGMDTSSSEYAMPAGSASEGEPLTSLSDSSGQSAQGQKAGVAGVADDTTTYDTWQPIGGQSAIEQTPTGMQGEANEGDEGDDESAAMPVTEDTMGGAPGEDSAAVVDGDDSGEDDSSMPGIVPILGSYSDADSTPTPSGSSGEMGALGASGALSSDTDGGATSGGAEWASAALNYLDQAQQAAGGGDWAGFGEALSNLRTYLQTASQGVQSSFAGLGAGASGTMQSSGGESMAGTGTGISSVADMGVGTTEGASGDSNTPSTSVDGGIDMPDLSSGGLSGSSMDADAGMPAMSDVDMGGASSSSMPGSMQSAPLAGDDTGTGTGDGGDMGADAGVATLEPAAEAGSLGAEIVSETPAETTMARLVMIATGAELPIPDQEEIMVGREDPSSGIFPDIDLTPYGGEDGGVSRRHARLFHIEDDYFVEDLQSTNYTKLDGQRLPAHVRERLEDGARLDFGRVATIFRRS